MKVLITDMYHSSAINEENVFSSYGIPVDHAMCKTEDELIETAKGYSALLVSYVKINDRVLDALPEVKAVVKYGVGVDNIDLEAAKRHNVAVFNVSDHCTEEVALHAMALTLDAERKISSQFADVVEGKWLDPKTKGIRRMSLLNIGLIGYGRISRRYREYISAIVKGKTYVYDPYAKKNDGDDAIFCESAAEVIAASDIVAVFTPLTPETREIINSVSLSGANNIVFINTSRGGTVNYEDLYDALVSGKISYIATDVWNEEPFEPEKELNQKFLKTGRITITPHAGWYSSECETELRRKAAEEIALYLLGKKEINRII